MDDSPTDMVICNQCGKHLPAMNLQLHQIHACGGLQPLPDRKPSAQPDSESSVEELETPLCRLPSHQDDEDDPQEEEEEDRKMAAIDLSTDSPQPRNVIDMTSEDDGDDDDDDDDVQAVQEQWACPRCTLYNDIAEPFCGACRLPNPKRPRNSGVRAADPVRRDRLLDDSPYGNYTDSPNSPPSSSLGLMSSGALLGGMLGATGGLVLGRDMPRSLLEGAVSGAVSGAVLSNLMTPPRNSRGSSSSAIHNPYRASGGISYLSTTVNGRTTTRVARFGPGRTDARLEALLQQLRGGVSQNNIDNMSYEQLLSRFGDGTENLGASESEINSLPVSTVEDPNSLPEDGRNCGICLEAFQAGEQKRTLPCWHTYHKACCDKWLRTNASCPICKTKIRN